ncbi:MAG: DUF1573 domain-containing protein [Chitinophagales bacterium]
MKNIIVILITFIAVSFITVNTMAQELKLSPNGKLEKISGPTMDFEQETHDFGDLPEGPKGIYVFKYTNNGTEPLIITKAKGSCGCTVPNPTPALNVPVMPGQSGEITVNYNTKNRIGTFTKSVTLDTNIKDEEGNPTQVRIYIKGKVLKAEEEETMPMSVPSIVEEQN